MNMRIIGCSLYFGGFLAGITIAFIMFCFDFTTYIMHTIIAGFLVTFWVACIAIIRQALRERK